MVGCGDQQLSCTHCIYGLFQFGSAASPWNTTVIPAGGEGTSYLKPLWRQKRNTGDEKGVSLRASELRLTKRYSTLITAPVPNH